MGSTGYGGLRRYTPAIAEDIADEAPKGRGRRPDWRWKFLDALATVGSPMMAARAAGVHYDTARAHRKKFPKFARRWDDALDLFVETAEVELRARAMDRADKASPILLIFMLKALRPHKYRDIPPPPKMDQMFSAEEVAALYQRVAGEEKLAEIVSGLRELMDKKAEAPR